jgi:uncharacterized repeat protein (TIGR01451 family)
MHNCKRRVVSGALVILCLLTGLSAPAWPSGNDNITLAATTPAPDLVIESVTFSPELPAIGNTLTFTVTIKNRGDIQAGASQLTCTIDEHHLAASLVGPVYPGAAVIKTFTWKALAGPHVFRAVIDSNDSIAESDETNNDKSYAFSILAPDLAIDAISWTPANPAVGETVIFTVKIINQGDKRAGVFHLDFFIDGNSRGYHSVLGIEAGESATETYAWVATPGLHSVRAAADVLNQVSESDETNNTAEAACATIQPDLTISSITMSPDDISENTTVTFSVNIINQGGSRAEPSSVTFYIEDSRKDSDFLGPLDPGETVTANFTWVAENRPLTFKAIVDVYNQIEESDETNNSGTVTFPQSFPDLLIQDMTWSPSTPLLHDFVSFTITVKNQGNGTSGVTKLSFNIDNAYFYDAIIPELTVNATTTTVFTFMTQLFSHTVEASIDKANFIKESDESNNTMKKTVTSTKLMPSADLVIENLTVSPAKPVIGETLTVTLRVKNQGTGTATLSYAAIYIDSNLMDSVYINELEAGAALTKDVTLPLQGLPFKDSYKVSVLLDCNNSVFETDELNNEKETSFSIYAPDLIIQAIRWSPEAPAAGDGITFDVTVKNRGDLKAGSTNISYYVDKTFMGRHSIEGIEAGTTVIRSFTWVAPAASFIFTAVIDEDNEITESDESNNSRTVDLPAPDLFIDSITWSPENPVEFSPATFTAVIGNRGQRRSAATLLSYYIDGAARLSLNTGEITPGGTTTVVFTYAFLSGEHAIRLVADGKDAIVESNETNNEKTISFSVQSLPTSTSPPAPESANTTTPPPPPGTTVTVQTSENLSSQNSTLAQTPVPDVAPNITAAPPKGQGILQSRWLITGTAALGIAVIGVLLLFRKKPKKS